MQQNHTSQAANAIMMVQPVRFCYNTETAVDNAFQKANDAAAETTQAQALEEFNNYTSLLSSKGVEVIVFQDTVEPHTPDSIFPNNWISFHDDGTLVLYPMKAKNRRPERRADFVEALESKHNFLVSNKIDITKSEEEGKFLEGTGSIVFDYINKVAYACISQRTDKEIFESIARKIGYKAVSFTSVDENGKEIYHTNVMMCIAEKFVLICADSIPDATERENVLKALKETNREIVLLSYKQINNFGGNALEVRNDKGDHFLVVSKTGFDSFTEEQKQAVQKYDEIIAVPLNTIEVNGGGSARCMMADIRLPKKN